MSKTISVGILGGGITGLSTAWKLKQHGVEVTVYEKNARSGGVIQSERSGDWLVEQGPNAFMIRTPELWDLLEELGVEASLYTAGRKAKKRFIVKNGDLKSVPLSPFALVGTPLLSAGAKIRLLKEPFIAPSAEKDESIAGFVERRLGREVLDYLANPFVAGIYAGDPAKISVKHTFSVLWNLEQQYGSLCLGAFKKLRKKTRSERKPRVLASFREGMAELPNALGKALDSSLRCQTEVERITHSDAGWKLQLITPGGREEAEHTVLISTLPVPVLKKLAQGPLSDIVNVPAPPYVPLSIIALGYRREQVRHPLDGFGMLIPETEPLKTLGTLFSSSLFPGRAPEGHVLLTSFTGGARNPEQALLPGGELIAETASELSKLLDISGEPVFTRHVAHKEAIPQYGLDHGPFLKSLKQFEETHPGFFITGNFRGGVSVPDCLMKGSRMAAMVTTYLGLL